MLGGEGTVALRRDAGDGGHYFANLKENIVRSFANQSSFAGVPVQAAHVLTEDHAADRQSFRERNLRRIAFGFAGNRTNERQRRSGIEPAGGEDQGWPAARLFMASLGIEIESKSGRQNPGREVYQTSAPLGHQEAVSGDGERGVMMEAAPAAVTTWCSDWCIRRTLFGARRAAIDSTDLRSPGQQQPVQYNCNGTARSTCPAVSARRSR